MDGLRLYWPSQRRSYHGIISSEPKCPNSRALGLIGPKNHDQNGFRCEESYALGIKKESPLACFDATALQFSPGTFLGWQ